MDRDTFFRLPQLVRAQLDRVGGRTSEDLPGSFRPATAQGLPAALTEHLAALRRAVGPAVEVAPPDDDLVALLDTISSARDPMNDAILLRLLGSLTGGVFRGPHTFHLDVANPCNVNCVYCWFHSPLAKNRADAAKFDKAWRAEKIDWDTFTALIDDLHALGTREDVLLSGKGEPLTHPRCLDMVQYIKARAMGVSLFTNGLLVKGPVREALVEHGADLLYVSLSSASHDVYEALHPGHPPDELDTVLDNIRELTALKRRLGSQLPRVMMVDVLTCRNAHEVHAFYEQATALGAEHVRFQLVHVQDYNTELMLSASDADAIRGQLARCREVAGGPTIVDNIDYQLETLDVTTGRWGHARTPDEGCYVGWTFSRSWTDGDVSFCCSPKVVDNLGERSFRDIWEGPRYSAFRNAARDLGTHGEMTFRNGAKLLGDHCNGCPNYEGISKLSADLRRYGLTRFVREGG